MPVAAPAPLPVRIEPTEPAVWTRTLALGLVGSLLCYLAHPPVGVGLLAWIGPATWLFLARLPRMPGRRPYLALWIAGAAYWLAAIQWIRLPHWANIFGLFLLAGYLGAYLPLFMGLVRVAVHRIRVPLWIAGPVVWTGFEWARARLLSGFLMASLAHTQVEFPTVIQIADTLGEYGVTFLIMLVAASIAEAIYAIIIHSPSEPGRPRPRSPRHMARMLLKLAPAALALAAALAYGRFRLTERIVYLESPEKPTATIALIQCDMLADWKGTEARDIAVNRQMVELSRDAQRASPRPISLHVWPETMYRTPLLQAEGSYRPPPKFFAGDMDAVFAYTPKQLGALARELDAGLLTGLDRVHWRRPSPDAAVDPEDAASYYDRFNAAACFDRTGQLAGTYDKMHLLPFGEYIPLVGWFPFLAGYSPLTGSASPGKLPDPIVVDNVHYSVNICYETVLPHVIRKQFVHLTAEAGCPPDVLVNLTNDAWYWGSSELDMHLASGMFRAIEMRTPLVIAANRGLSGHIDRLGRVVAVSERDVPAYVLVEVELPPRQGNFRSLFAAYGDWFALVCLVCCVVPAAAAWRGRRAGKMTKLE